ncbi:MAG: Ig-like domain-containing protein [Bacilli bacterium]|nr:Ig-like domain-containing protein [Bacilli bacterium]
MKKVFRNLLILSISVTGLSGCDLFSSSEGVVEKKEEKGIELRDYTQTVIKDESYTFDGKVFLKYEDESEKEVTSDCSFDYSELDTSKVGTNTHFFVRYEGDQYKFTKKAYLRVETLTLLSIDAIDYTESVKALETYTFDGKVIALYNNNSTKDVTSQADIGTIDTSKAGTKDLNITYVEENNLKKVTKQITVTKELLSITISGYTASYEVGQGNYTFNGTIIANYSDGSTENVTNKADKSNNVDLSTIGNYEFSASFEYEGVTKTASVEIRVCEHTPVLQSIAASGYSTEVDKGNTYTFDGTVMATFDVGSPVDVTSSCTFASISTSTTGNKSLKITYTDPNDSTNKKTTTITIEVIARVTGISAEDSYKVAVSKTKSLNASVLPSDAKNKGLTYSSSNSSVCSVSSTGVITGNAVGTASITITSEENSSINKVVTVTVDTVVQDEWTILMYVCGADLESDYASSNQGAATDDLKEIAQVTGQPDGVNVVVQAGGASKWSSTYSSVINKDYRNRFHLQNRTYVKDSQVGKVNMGLSSSLQDFIEWGLETYPAENVGLILWNHGGAMGGCCYDEQFSNDGLTPAEVKSAIKAARSTLGMTEKFEFIGYDCCLMQVQDIAGLNSEYAKYQIAAEESEWGDGWEYTAWIDDLFQKKSTTNILKAIVDGFNSSTTSGYSGSGYANDQTLSYLDLSKWAAYETAWEDMSSTLSTIITSSTKWNTFKNLLNSCQRFGETQDYYGNTIYPFDVFDAGHFLTKIKSNSNYSSNSTLMSKVDVAKAAYNDLVAYEWHGSGSPNASGLSMFAPVSGYSSQSDYSTSSTTLTTYRSICISYGSWN